MGLRSRGPRRIAFERDLERFAPVKKRLIRWNNYNCSTCVIPYRPGEYDPFCSSCAGSGYASGTASVTNYFMWCDIQPGHGIYGAGGDFVSMIADLGKVDVGDALGFCKYMQWDTKGKLFYPSIDKTLTRSDQIVMAGSEISRADPTQIDTYFVTKSLVMNVGDEIIGRMLTLDIGRAVAKSN
jgi:hypothetical protein